MKWYVLNHDFNKDEIEAFNIFNSSNFNEGVEKALKNYTTFENFVNELDKVAMYSFWCKAEYEILCSGLVTKNDRVEKIDVYTQIKPNIELLAWNIVSNYNKHKRKKLDLPEI